MNDETMPIPGVRELLALLEQTTLEEFEKAYARSAPSPDYLNTVAEAVLVMRRVGGPGTGDAIVVALKRAARTTIKRRADSPEDYLALAETLELLAAIEDEDLQ